MGLAMLFYTIVSVAVAARNELQVAATGDRCRRSCGSIDVPYPFGIVGDDPSCYFDFDFLLKCSSTFTPSKLFSRDYEVIGINISFAKMRVLTRVSYDCYNSSGQAETYFGRTRLLQSFAFSYTDNQFFALGCDTVAFINGTNNYTGGCFSHCDSMEDIVDGYCSGIGCCQMAAPRGLKEFNFDFGSLYNHTSILEFNLCSYLFLVEKSNYTFKISDLKTMVITRQFPVVWDWYIENHSCQEAMKNKGSYACTSENSHCLNSTNDPGYTCRCSQGYEGNPYVLHGCQDIDECMDPKNYPCKGTCLNIVGSYNCTCPLGTEGNPKTYGCTPSFIPSKHYPITMIISVFIAVAIFVVAICIWIYFMIQKRKFMKHKEKYFHQNGGFLLQTQISSQSEIQKTFKIFTKEEIDKVTNRFDTRNIIGRGGQGVVYKGKLPNDKRELAIKKSVLVDRSKVDEFINEIVILSKINHKNVVRLLGCCLEVEAPLLVYEFIPNGTLFFHIHESCLPWEMRLKIAYDTADALAHLHFMANTPIIHRDVKSSNILIDTDYIAKISDFGASKMVPNNEQQVTTLVRGTLGYLDPEYLQKQQLINKSDVYSFGVVLLELITGMLPYSCERSETERVLATVFLSYLKWNRVGELFDGRIAEASNESQLEDVANLAMRCLNLQGEERPSMIEVLQELEIIMSSACHPWTIPCIQNKATILGESLTSSQEPQVSRICLNEEYDMSFFGNEEGG